MKVLERFIAAKSGMAEECEDGIIVTGHFAAVVDGATDKGSRRYDGMTPGRFAALACLEAIKALEPASDVKEAVRSLSECLAARLPSDTPEGEGPTAVAVVYSAARREIWQIGDAGFWHDGMPEDGGQPVKLIDRYAAELRAAILHARIGAGADPAQLMKEDPGRAAIHGILVGQKVFRNNPGADRWAYAALDGSPVDLGLVTVHPVPDDVDSIILASDGYPAILPTLQASEKHLVRLLREDPLCIGPLLGTKGVAPGNVSYDDRSYLKLAL